MKILVRGTNWIGDAVMSIPALRELRRIFPDARISLHTRAWAEGLFRDAEFIDELVTFEKHRWKIKDVYDNSRFLAADGYDLALLLPNSFEAAVTAFLTRIPRRFGYNKDIRGILLTDPIAVPEWKNRRHEVYYYLNLVGEIERRMLGRDSVSMAFPDISVEVSEERRTAAQLKLIQHGADPLKNTVALGVGSTNSTAKRWPAEKYAKLSDLIAGEIEANVVLVGSPKEKAVANEVVGLCLIKPVDLVGETTLDEATAILSEIDILVSNDMGLAHVAAAVGTETIAIFGPTNPETTRPFSQNAEVIREEVECSPCMLRDCPIDHRCMTRISVERVMIAVTSRLEENDEPENKEKTGYIP